MPSSGYTYNGRSGLIPYGPNSNCTLDTCPISWSVYQYQPSLAANIVFLVVFFVALVAHLAHGLRFREWFFTSAMVLGCLSEIIGYAGRIMLHYNPFGFTGFMIQICCITFAPVFYCAAIYVLLSRITLALDPGLGRVPPRFWYWFFIPCDIVSLVLQGMGGGMSSSSTGVSQTGVNISIAGLSFQVVTLALFSVGVVDYAVRYAKKPGRPRTTTGFKLFAACLGSGIVLIFIRCAYRIQELRKGYRSDLMSDQGLFIGLEGVIIVLAAFVLLGAMPGPHLQPLEAEVRRRKDEEVAVATNGNGAIASDEDLTEKEQEKRT